MMDIFENFSKEINYKIQNIVDLHKFINLKLINENLTIIDDYRYSNMIFKLIKYYQFNKINRFEFSENEEMINDISSKIIKKKYKKKLCILCYKCSSISSWDPDSIEIGIPGSEECVIYLSQVLSNMDYDVIIEGVIPNSSIWSNIHSNPRYISESLDIKYDILVAWRRLDIQNYKNRARKVYLWAHDFPRSNMNIIEGINGIFLLTKYHETIYKRYLKIPSIICGNGINIEQFKNPMMFRNPYSCGYFSNYSRGLNILLDIWPIIKNKYPEATLSIYYGRNTYNSMDDNELKLIIDKIENMYNLDVYEKGKIGHKELAKEMSNISLWLYPCNSIGETFCITSIKAQCAGMLPITTRIGALNETVCDYAFKVDSISTPTEIEFYKNLIINVMSNIHSKQIYEKRLKCIKFAKKYTWERCAKIWHETFNSELTFKKLIIKNKFIICKNKNLLISLLCCNNARNILICLDHINKLEYPKNKILFYIKCFICTDNTISLIKNWINDNKHYYFNIFLDIYPIKDTLDNIIDIKNKTIEYAIKNDCDYLYLLPNCFLESKIINHLYKNKLPIIAPLIKSKNSLYSNFNYEIDNDGFFKSDDNDFYYKIFYQQIKGIIEVKAIKYCYLIRRDYLEYCITDKLNIYYEYINFADHCRLNDISLYLDNRIIGGYLDH